jgi:hypothetical protein
VGWRAAGEGARAGGWARRLARIRRRPTAFPLSFSSRLVWLPACGTPGLATPWTAVALHALAATGGDDGPPAVLCLLDAGGGDAVVCGADDDDAGSSDGDASASPELRFAPADASIVDAIFAAMCRCAELNPDPAMLDEDDDGAGEWITDAASLAAAEAAGVRSDLGALLLSGDPDRFDDADE